MTLKELLKNTISGAEEVTEVLMNKTTELVKAGTHDIEEIFRAVIELGAEGVLDTTAGVKSVFVGSVNALKESGKTTEEAVEEVSEKAVTAIGGVTETGLEEAGKAAQKGVEEAKATVQKPFQK